MLTIFIPDSVADKVHEREAPVTLEAGLKQATYAALAADCISIGLNDDQAFLTKGVYHDDAKYEERDGCGIIWGDADGRCHYFGVVVGPDLKIARRVAEALLTEIRDDDQADLIDAANDLNDEELAELLTDGGVELPADRSRESLLETVLTKLPLEFLSERLDLD